jgi:GNAT superfamily N-acetyltransferase
MSVVLVDHQLHSRFDQWLAKSEARGRTNVRVLVGAYAKTRMRYWDGRIHIAVVAVKRKHQRQGVFTAFLEHREATGRVVVVEWVENDHLQRFMERRPGYDKEDDTGGLAPTWRTTGAPPVWPAVRAAAKAAIEALREGVIRVPFPGGIAVVEKPADSEFPIVVTVLPPQETV